MTRLRWHRVGVSMAVVVALATGVVLASATSAPAYPAVLAGVAPGAITCSIKGTVHFSPGITGSGGGTNPSTVNGELRTCNTDEPPLRPWFGSLRGSFSKSPLNCATMTASGATANFTISWTRYPNLVFDPTIMSSSGEQVVTTGGGQIGLAVPGSGFTASTTGSFSGGSATANLYFSDTLSALSAACSTKHGIKKLDFTGNVTLSNTPEVVSEFTAPSINGAFGITDGPDGAVWFTNNIGNSIGRITTTGVVSSFSDPSINGPYGITAGPDGNLWFTNSRNNSIGRITTAGVVSHFSDPSINGPYGITAGPDGNLWFVNNGSQTIGRITTAGAVSNFPVLGLHLLGEITAGPDGALWFTSVEASGSVGRITTAGVVSNFPCNCSQTWITAGPDGALWFTSTEIGRMTTAGVVSFFTRPGTGGYAGITTGPDGNLWNVGGSYSGGILVIRITPSGVVTPFVGPGTGQAVGGGITKGPDGNLWFTNPSSIERITP